MMYPSLTEEDILTVSGLNNLISNIIDMNFGYIRVAGEVSNLRTPSSGHRYFTLKDEESQLKAVIFRGRNTFIDIPEICNGQMLVCFGRLGVYKQRGEYQLIVEQVESAGAGSLHLAFEALKDKLEKEGLFDVSRKNPMPFYPRRIGIITSSTGAALTDILKILKKKPASIEVLLVPSSVQGEKAVSELCSALKLLNSSGHVDIIIISRGGGSIEDLWNFNSEQLARAIFNSKTPVISAVGHERDYTICDFAADLRAPTPSVAAEMIVDTVQNLHTKTNNLGEKLESSMFFKLANLKNKLLLEKRGLKGPEKKIIEWRLKVDELLWRAEKACRKEIDLVESRFSGIAKNLNSLSPLAVLARGYSITTRLPEGDVLKDISQLRIGNSLNVRLQKGRVTCEVKKIHS